MMQQCYRYILPLLCCLLLAACGSDDGTSPANTATGVGGTQPIMFSAGMGAGKQAATRAATDINDKPTLSAKGGFGVFGCYTGLHRYSDSNVRPDFMYNEHVTSADGTTWTYSPLKYWPNGEGETSDGSVTGDNPHYVSFMAYAPYSDNNGLSPDTNPAGYCIPSFSLQGEIGNPWLTYRLIEQAHINKQVDLLYAKHSNVHPILDQTKPLATNSKVLFDFKHALACVGDKITIICSSGIKNQVDSRVVGGVTQARVVIKNFKIEYTLTSKARLVLWNQGEPNWQAIFSEAPICERTVTIVPNATDPELVVYTNGSTGDPCTVTGKGVFYIPKDLQGYPQTAKITVTYCISTYNGISWTDDSDNTGSVTISMKEEYPDAYQPGKHLYFNITLNQMSIGLTAAIAPWEVADPVEIEGIEE
jgi:hypothetical protein